MQSEYKYGDSFPTHANAYLWGPLLHLLDKYSCANARVFELGCGNGATAGMLASKEYDVTAVDPSTSGVTQAINAFPDVRFKEASSLDWPHREFGQFDVVISLEVIEHCFSPKQFASAIRELTKPGGLVLISTPFHGYWKNLALALTNKWDFHLTALWEGGHIKFFSIRTLRQLMEEEGFAILEVVRVGRLPPIAKTMLFVARRPYDPD